MASYVPVSICGMRVALLESGGGPDVGATNGYTFVDPLRLQMGVEVATGTDIEQRNGCGALVAALKDPDKIKRYSLTLDLAKFDFNLKQRLLGGTLLGSGGNDVGYIAPGSNDTSPQLCAEFWVKAQDGSAQAVPAITSPDAAYYHFVFPNTTWVQANDTFENGTLTVDQVTGSGIENPAMAATGPFGDWPGFVSAQGGIDTFYGVWLDNDVPASTGEVATTVPGS